MQKLFKLLFFAACLFLGFNFAKLTKEDLGSPAHYHVDIKIYINGVPVDLSKPEFQSTDSDKKSPYIHLHDGSGDVVHLHHSGMTIGDILHALGGSLTPNCLKISGLNHCTGLSSSLRVYVNGSRILLPQRYEPKDLDRILITYNPHFSDITGQLNSLTDNACLYSYKCPQRGEPPTESCNSTPDSPCVLPGTDGSN